MTCEAPEFPLPERSQLHRWYEGRYLDMRSACSRLLRDGEAHSYVQAHLVARWCLGLVREAPVLCRHCGTPDTKRRLYAALDWESAPADRLRADHVGNVYSVRPDLDYIPLCGTCHGRYDRSAWRRIALAPIAATTR